ncbi:MAG: hypothetical protein LBR39_03805 [Coriobacteriales bacterium]|jgi:hypothetical protein|nr:hypothetical protein [Coriobacteriales bacterium]
MNKIVARFTTEPGKIARITCLVALVLVLLMLFGVESIAYDSMNNGNFVPLSFALGTEVLAYPSAAAVLASIILLVLGKDHACAWIAYLNFIFLVAVFVWIFSMSNFTITLWAVILSIVALVAAILSTLTIKIKKNQQKA